MGKKTAMGDLNNLPLTKNQRRLWISYLQDKGNPSYNLKLTYHLQGSLDIEILKRSISLLFHQHHSVFSVFRQMDGVPHVEIHPSDFEIMSIDFSSGDAATSKEKVYEFVATDSRKPFDLETGPLLRLYILKAGTDDHYFHGTIHHIVFDGFSRRVFVQELSRIYNGLMKSNTEGIDLNISQSYDFAAWETQTAVDQNEDTMISFWKQNLKDSPLEIKFPYDHPRKNIPSGYGYRESFSVSADISQKLKRLAREEGTSPFETVLSTVGLLLNKYTGEDDICIGIPVSTRLRNPKLWKIFGYFVNTGVVRILIDEAKSFRELLKSTGKAAKDAVVNSNLPFEKIVDAVKPQRIPGLNPLFQVSLSWFTNFTVPMELGGIVGERVNVSEGVAPFDMTFLIWENGDFIQGEIEYSTDLFEHETILRLKENFIDLLGQLVECPDREVSSLTVLSKNELKLIEELNSNEAPVPDIPVHELFSSQVRMTPDNIAVIFGENSYTYRELEHKSNRLANYLIYKGVRSGCRIGLSLERSAEMVVAQLAILKTGSCYVPLDPLLPADRLNYMLEDSGAGYLISQTSLKGMFQAFKKTAIFIDGDATVISGQPEERPGITLNPDDLAYIIYTSGSTGKPKGVKVHHQAVVNFLESMKVLPGITSSDKLLAVTTLSFDISVLEIFLPLICGAQIVVAGSGDLTDGQKLAKLIEKHDITVLQATPVTWALLIGSGWRGKLNLHAFSGGEAIPPSLAHDLCPKVKELWNFYGPTETTVWSTIFRIDNPSSRILVGRPIRNTRLYVLDKNKLILPVGCVGEVCIGGMGVTMGYNNLPELTSERFIRFPDGSMVYRTGDLGRLHPDGNLELFGRMDNQLKVRGFRIEAGEIESLLMQLEGVREAVVKIHEFSPGDQRLVAFLNAAPEFILNDEEIRRHLGKSLPAYMIPSFYRKSDSFPRMPNGKINRNGLILDIFDSSPATEEVLKLTETQEKIIGIFRDVLKHGNIRLTENFFDIGGNSLLAISVFSKIESLFEIKLSLRTFFDGPCVKDLADVVDYTNYKTTNRRSDTDSESVIIKGEI